MINFLNDIRNAENPISNNRKLINTIAILFLGIALGTFSKYLDFRQTELPGVLMAINGVLDIGNFLGRFAIWILIALCISIYSNSAIRASINVFVFFVGMVASYYLYSNYIAGFFPRSYAMIWFGFTAVSPLLAFVCWYAKGKSKLAFILSALILAVFGNNFDGYGMIRESQEYALTFGEELTDETLQQLVRDWHDNTSSLVLTTKNGWGKIAFAKVLTGLAFTVELFTILAIPNILSQIFFMGTSGWDMPIQNIKLIAIAPMNMLQAEIYEYVFALLGAIGFAGVVMFISASMKNNVLALLFSLACVYGPMMIAEYLPYELQKVLDLLPLVGSGADIFRTNTFHIFGKYVWSPYLLVTVPILVGIFCMPFAVRNWSRRMKV